MADPVITDVKYSVFTASGDGVKTLWDFNFAGAEGTPGYIDRAHVKIFLTRDSDGFVTQVPVTPDMWVGQNTLRVLPAVPVGTTITIYRDTPKDKPLVNFTTTAILNEQNLDRMARQSIYASAEMVDRFLATKDAADGAAAKADAALTNSNTALTQAAEALASSAIARTESFTAVTTANNAQTAAGAATTTANAAQATANAIDGKATTALTNAAAAVTTANAASATAGTALSTANTATTTANGAVTTANNAATTAGTALSTANTAKTTADAAATSAATAVSTANTASTTAGTALTNANSAVGTANTANGNASTALSTANAAASTANGIDAKATTALANANSAVSTANGVDAKATTALSNSATALSTANAAATTANGVDAKAQSALDLAGLAMPKTGGAFTGDVAMQSINGGQLGGFRNRIMNGNFTVNQRAQTTYTEAGITYDRWKWQLVGTLNRIALGTNVDNLSEAGTSSVFAICTSPYTPTGGDFAFIEQVIEGYDIADLKWGTAGAKPITIQFKAYSNFNGLVVTLALRNGNATRSRLIPVALTTTPQTYFVTVPGDTTGLWDSTSGGGLSFAFTFAVGTGFTSGTANTWLAGNLIAHTSQSNMLSTLNRAITFTDIQVERGSFRSAYEWRPRAYEYEMCRRYFQRWSSATFLPVASGFAYQTNAAAFSLQTTPMRGLPSFNMVNGSVHSAVGAQVPVTSYAFLGYNNGGAYIQAATGGSLTVGQGTTLNVGTGTGGYMELYAEFA